MKTDMKSLVGEIKKHDLSGYKYLMIDYEDIGWSWFVLFNLKGALLRATSFGLSHPPGTTQEELDQAVESFKEVLDKEGPDKLYEKAFSLEKFVTHIEAEFGGDFESQERTLREILQCVEKMEVQLATGSGYGQN